MPAMVRGPASSIEPPHVAVLDEEDGGVVDAHGVVVGVALIEALAVGAVEIRATQATGELVVGKLVPVDAPGIDVHVAGVVGGAPDLRRRPGHVHAAGPDVAGGA